jgi:hypothetical protein
MSLPEKKSDLACRRCGGALEAGYVIERKSAYQDTEAWVEGDPEPRRFSAGKDLRERRVLPVVSYRCEECGQLEFFAPDS